MNEVHEHINIGGGQVAAGDISQLSLVARDLSEARARARETSAAAEAATRHAEVMAARVAAEREKAIAAIDRVRNSDPELVTADDLRQAREVADNWADIDPEFKSYAEDLREKAEARSGSDAAGETKAETEISVAAEAGSVLESVLDEPDVALDGARVTGRFDPRGNQTAARATAVPSVAPPAPARQVNLER